MTYFPLTIKYEDGRTVVVRSQNEIERGKSFKVLKCTSSG